MYICILCVCILCVCILCVCILCVCILCVCILCVCILCVVCVYGVYAVCMIYRHITFHNVMSVLNCYVLVVRCSVLFLDEVNAHKLLLNILHLVKVTCTSTLSSMKECSREHFRHIQRFLRESGLQHTLIGKR